MEFFLLLAAFLWPVQLLPRVLLETSLALARPLLSMALRAKLSPNEGMDIGSLVKLAVNSVTATVSILGGAYELHRSSNSRVMRDDHCEGYFSIHFTTLNKPMELKRLDRMTPYNQGVSILSGVARLAILAKMICV